MYSYINNLFVTLLMRNKIIILLLIIILFFSSFSAALMNKKSIKSNLYEIIRDDWGIPHIIADTDIAAFFGAGYASAEDRLFQMHRNRYAAQGRLAELMGTMLDNTMLQKIIEQDKYFRYIGLYKYAETMATAIDEPYQSYLQSYCNGVNQYIQDNQNQLSELFNRKIPEKWTIADCIVSWDRMGDYFSGFPSSEVSKLHEFENLVESIGYDQAIEQMTIERIIDDNAATTKYDDYTPETLEAIYAYANNITNNDLNQVPNFITHQTPKMSHAWVVGGKKTTTGSSVLSSDPQTKVTSPSIWYEYHMKSNNFNTRGIGVAGCPGFLIGWNEHVAWGATALGADQADLFRLKMIDEQTYEYDNNQYRMDISEETISVPNGRDISISVKSTILGPVVTKLLPSANPNEEFVLCSYPQYDKSHHSIEALLDMMKADDVYSFYNAIQKYKSPGIHCIFGDKKGNIGYSVMAAIPLRSSSSALAGSIAQNGSSSKYAWIEMIPYKVLPHVFNPADGVLFSANHLPVGSWYPIPLYLGQGGSGDGSRSWRLRELLTKTNNEKFTPEEIYNIHYDTVDPTRREIVRIGLYIQKNQGQVFSADANAGLNILQSWFQHGAQCITTEPYYAAAHFMDLYFREERWPDLTAIYGGGESGLCHFLKTIKEYLDENISYNFNETEITFFDYVLSSGYNKAVTYYGIDENNWMGSFQYNGPGKYTIKYFDTLENFGSINRNFDKTYYITNVNGGSIGGQMSQSYSQWVTLSDIVSSRAILPVGINENVDDEHFQDQENLWLNLTMRSSPIEQNGKKVINNIQQKDNLFFKKIIEIFAELESFKTIFY